MRRHVGCEILVRRRDRRVVADRGIALVHRIDDLLAIDAVFQSHTGFVGLVRGVVAEGHEGEAVAGALGLQHVDLRRLHDEADGLRIESIDGIDLPRNQRLGAGRRIRDVTQFHAVEPGAVRLPVMSGVLGQDANAGLEVFERISACPVGLREVREPVRHDEDVVIRQIIGQIGIAAGQRNGDLIGVDLLDVGDGAEKIFGSRLRFAAMQVQRIDDVVGIEGLAGMERHALADIEDPIGGTGLGFPRLEQFAGRIAGWSISTMPLKIWYP